MAIIVNYPVLGEPEYAGPRLQLHGECLARPMAFGNRWSVVQIGIRFTLGVVSDNLTLPSIYSHNFVYGLCQGTTNSWDSDYTDFAFGGGPGDGTTTTLAAVNSPPYWYSFTGGSAYWNGWYGFKQGKTITSSGLYFGPSRSSGVSATPTYSQGGLGHPTNSYITIKRGGANSGKIDVSMSCASYAQLTLGRRRTFWMNMQREQTANLNSTVSNYSNNTAATWYKDPAQYPLDCAMINWGLTFPCLELMDFSVIRFR